jgi:hypothetical protein
MPQGPIVFCPDKTHLYLTRFALLETLTEKPLIRKQTTMNSIINGNFQDLNAAKRAITDLLGTGFSADRTSCFSVEIPGHNADTYASEATVLEADGQAKEAPQAAEGALSGAALGGAIGAAVALATLPVLGPIVAATAVGVGAYGGSLYGALGGMAAAASEETEASIMAMQNAKHRQSGTLVAVVANDDVQQDTAKRILHSHGALDIELRDGTLQNGQWLDFNPNLPLQLVRT